MIVTVTANPALDLTYALPAIADGEADVHRATRSTLEASGKGVNVSRALTNAGVPTCAILPAGGPAGRALAELLDDDGVAHRIVLQSGETRVNTSALRPGGETVKLNGPGATLTRAECAGLLRETTLALEQGAVWLAVCGSLPPGVGAQLITELVELAHRYEVKCAVDASGEALAAALNAGADLLAPNRFELAEVSALAKTAASIDELGEAALALSCETGSALLVSLGRDGALFTDGRRVLHGWGPPLTPLNTAGAGDALLAGWLVDDTDPSVRLSRAIAWGRSACLAETTVDPRPGEGDAAPVTLRDIGIHAEADRE